MCLRGRKTEKPYPVCQQKGPGDDPSFTLWLIKKKEKRGSRSCRQKPLNKPRHVANAHFLIPDCVMFGIIMRLCVSISDCNPNKKNPVLGFR